MVALEGREPVGVLLGAKRAAATLVYALRVHPDHRRRGHGRHLLTSLGQKLAILGPPRLLAEVPGDRAAACALFEACRWRAEGRLVDWRRPPTPSAGSGADGAPVSPIRLEEALESGLLSDGARCWRRDLAALGRLGEELLGLGFHSPERLEACLFARAAAGPASDWELLALGATAGDVGRMGLRLLLAELERRAGAGPLELSRTAPGEVDAAILAESGFCAGAEYLVFATEASAA